MARHNQGLSTRAWWTAADEGRKDLRRFHFPVEMWIGCERDDYSLKAMLALPSDSSARSNLNLKFTFSDAVASATSNSAKNLVQIGGTRRTLPKELSAK